MSFFHSFDLLKSLKLTPKALYQAFSLVHSRNISVTVAVPGTHPGGEIVVLVALLYRTVGLNGILPRGATNYSASWSSTSMTIFACYGGSWVLLHAKTLEKK